MSGYRNTGATEDEFFGKVAYEGWTGALANPISTPWDFEDLPDVIREAWISAALAVRSEL